VVKNQNALIRALDPLAARLKFRLRFLGGIVETSDYAKEFTALVRARAWCEYLGWAEPPVIQRHLGQASALILPSVEENLGLVILEAMAAGVPVAGSAVGGIVDLITEGETGLLFDPNDSESMRSKVELLLEKTAWARSMAARAKVAVERYRPEAIARVHLEIYRKMAKTRQN
jgi:glycosyltransferase involved in cell wall biosynthesis